MAAKKNAPAVRRAPVSKQASGRRAASAPVEETRFFRSFDGSDIRVDHPDGSVAIVGAEYRTLPKKLWRLAIKRGCVSDTTINPADLPGLSVADDAFTRKQRIKDMIVEALQSDEEDPRFADAFTPQDIPDLRWLEKACGFPLSAEERDAAWDEVQRDMPDPEEDEGEDGDESGDENDKGDE